MRIGSWPNKVADLRSRPEFLDWEVDLQIQYNAHLFRPEQVINLLRWAGDAVGVGENRPEKTGNDWGTFDVKKV